MKLRVPALPAGKTPRDSRLVLCLRNVGLAINRPNKPKTTEDITTPMQKQRITLAPISMGLALLAGLALALMPIGTHAQEPIEIQCSPSTVYLGAAANGDWLTVHTDLPYDPTSAVSAEVNGVTLAAALIKPDNCGNLVAKFSLLEVRDALAGKTGTVTVTLMVEVASVAYEGSDDVRVVVARISVGQGRVGRNQNQSRYQNQD